MFLRAIQGEENGETLMSKTPLKIERIHPGPVRILNLEWQVRLAYPTAFDAYDPRASSDHPIHRRTHPDATDYRKYYNEMIAGSWEAAAALPEVVAAYKAWQLAYPLTVDEPMYKLSISERQRATILAALRGWMKVLATIGMSNQLPDLTTLATHGGEYPKLDVDEVDDLCAEIAQFEMEKS